MPSIFGNKTPLTNNWNIKSNINEYYLEIYENCLNVISNNRSVLIFFENDERLLFFKEKYLI